MSEESDDSSKTEEPSHKKLEDARKKGQTFSSREINHFFMMLALTFFIMIMAPGLGRDMIDTLGPFITKPDEMDMDSASFMGLMRTVTLGTVLALALLFLASIAAAIAPAVVQNKWVFSTESIKPKFNKISPLAGAKRLFGLKALVEFAKSLLKVTVVGTIAFYSLMPYKEYLYTLPALPKADMLEFSQQMAGRMLIAVLILLFLLSIGDYLWQRFMFMKQMRMTKQELKEEYKQQEGDPHIKGKLKAIRREKAKQRMTANVPKADVIITNPTHYAVALKYDAAKMPAPVLLAKGTDDVAARIRELAAQNKIPIVRNPPLARVLYDTTDIEDEIPIAHYAAVAKVIGYVYKLKGKVPQKPAPKGPGGAPGKPSAMTINMPQKKK